MRQYLAVLISVLLMGAASSAQAQTQPPTIDADILCFVVSAALASSPDNSVRGVALINSMYFMGRIDTQSMPRAEVNRRMKVVIDGMDSAGMRTELQTCSQRMREAGNKYRIVGQQLRERPGQ